MHKFIWTF